MIFSSNGPAGPTEHPAGVASSSENRQQQMPVPFSGGRKPTPCSVRIANMQDSNAATTGSGAGGANGSSCWELGINQTTTTWVSCHPSSSSSFPCSRVWSSHVAKASVIGGVLPTTFISSSQTPDAHLCDTLAAPRKFRSPGLHLELLRDPSCKTHIHFSRHDTCHGSNSSTGYGSGHNSETPSASPGHPGVLL